MLLFKPGEAPEDYHAEEYCPFCDSYIPILWEDHERQEDSVIDYQQTCPVCGKRLMLCSTCQNDGNECYGNGCNCVESKNS